MIRTIVTVGGAGLVPWAPGTWGSAVAIPLTWGIHFLGGFPLVAALTLAVILVGLWATGQYLAGREDDPSEVVIDETAGMMLTLWPLSYGLWAADAAPHVFPWPGWVIGFLLFRFFDILKPVPVKWFDRPGALFVMLDDLVAGVLAAALVFTAAWIAHG
ncbi:MAG: phosphatidylglycerophosphatase A [Pseudomonadota bacterium]